MTRDLSHAVPPFNALPSCDVPPIQQRVHRLAAGLDIRPPTPCASNREPSLWLHTLETHAHTHTNPRDTCRANRVVSGTAHSTCCRIRDDGSLRPPGLCGDQAIAAKSVKPSRPVARGRRRSYMEHTSHPQPVVQSIQPGLRSQ